ncbi:MAG: hypothetical protein WC835_00015 [Candidatus Paceibacterota bacterium]
MDGMQKQRNLILILIIIVLGAGFFIYRDLRGGKETTPEAGPSAGNIEVTLPDAEKVQNGALQGSDEITPVNIAVPDLNRAITFTITLSDSEKEKIIARASELTGLLKKDANSLDNWLALGLLRKTIGDYEGARQAWEYASAIRPKNSVSFRNLGDLYHYYLKDYPKAEFNLKQSVKNDPLYIGTYRALVDLYIQSYTNKLSEVPNVLADGLKSNPNQYDLLIMMATYYKNAGDKTNAKIYYERALSVADKSGMTSMKQIITDEIQKLSQ